MKTIFSQKGQSLIQVIISMAISMIILSAIASTMVAQQKEVKGLGEVIASKDLQSVLTATLTKSSACLFSINTPSPASFDSTSLPQKITIPKIYTSASYAAPAVVEQNKAVSPFASTLVAENIELNIKSGTGNTYLAEWQIHFAATSLVRALKPVVVSTILAVDTTVPAVARIIGCHGSASGMSIYTKDYDLLASNSLTLPEGQFLVLLNSRVKPTIASADYSYMIQLKTDEGPTEIQTGFADVGGTSGAGTKEVSGSSFGYITVPAYGTTLKYQVTENTVSPGAIDNTYIHVTVVQIQ
ncbi:hypothetical protein [Bdellovibrio sp. HCB337]|uniref:hypothetical protein n=1 Tax=Bdellovibrio sp. HCB337 TaxID=3394358 RepID=UPI0039A53BA5